MTKASIEIDFSENIEINHPKCVHGPTLLFHSSTSKFFACSACRDRQECDIFIPYDERNEKGSKKMIQQNQREYERFKKHIQTLQKKRKIFNKKLNIYYCYTCSILFSEKKQSNHIDHQCTESLNRQQLRQPCQYVLQPLEKKRTNAQFFFSQTFIDYLINEIISKNSWDSVICIGCPTIFENLHRFSSTKSIQTYLLDYDYRLCSFYSTKQMLIYNMFNGHIFSKKKYFQEKFLKTIKNCLIVIDPPFGGFHRALSYSIEKLFQSSDINRDIILFNPYFLEKWIIDAFPNLKMLDYKVEYSSISTLNLCRGRKGSPVRMFTDISRSKFPPLDDVNYKYCFECDLYTLLTNQHCFQCQSCTSKDGLPYKHCSLCKRCVKAERVHCNNCNVCHLANQCMTNTSKRKNESADDQTKKIKV
ncbi:unnamed protein product [Rotaria magnacalcarata]|uniref:Zinc finger CCHC domain-containing protein 4 n=1 Tax=Rotaria magnacalcarata TaxID=392030 RepID=A0A819X7C9_9BILA|nr:unnamed protein product [Rotaria magnacalcarata]CAF4136353.1 unnamed protein product [Rotaria magnacalcarata]